MLPDFNHQSVRRSHRRGAVLPLFTFLLPVLLIFCGFAINLAYMQMVSTDIKIATDAAAHAGGRAMSILQTTDGAVATAQQIAQANSVGGLLSMGGNNGQIQVGFGVSTRASNGYGMYQFTSVPKANVDNRSQRANSVSVTANVNLPLVFQAMNFSAYGGNMTHFDVSRRSIATQVDRDIAMVLDRSGSMLYYMDDARLTSVINTLYNAGRITSTDRSNALRSSLYDRTYTSNVVYQIERYLNPSHKLGTSYTQTKQSLLTQPMSLFVSDWLHFYQTTRSRAPRFSRWYFLVLGVNAFLDVLDQTDQIEYVSLVTFASDTRVDLGIQTTYDSIRNTVASIVPNNATATGNGMLTSVPTIMTAPSARIFAAKTMVVLTDGAANSGTTPVNAATQIRASNNITIHAVTFTPETLSYR
jgi:Ca-activated chloride channel homolog